MAVKQKVVSIQTQQAQTSVKDLRMQLKELRNTMLSCEEGTEEYNKALTQAAEITHTLRELTEFINATAMDFGQVISNVNGAIGGMIGGLLAAKATMNLFGVENEAVLESLQKMQSLMAISQALPAIDKGIKSFQKLAIAIKASSTALKGLSTAAVATGIGAIVVAVGALATAFGKLKEKQDAYVEKQKEQIRLLKEEQIKAQEQYNESLKRELDLKERLLNIKFDGNDVKVYTAILAEYQRQLGEVNAKLNDQYNDAAKLEAKKVYRQLNEELGQLTEGSEEYMNKLLEITSQEQKIKDIKPLSPEEIEALTQRQTELNGKITEYGDKLTEAKAIAAAMRAKEAEDIQKELDILEKEILAFLTPKSLQDELLAKFADKSLTIPVKVEIEEEEEEDTSFEDSYREKIIGTILSLRQAFITPEEQYQQEIDALDVALKTKLISEEEYLKLRDELNKEQTQREIMRYSTAAGAIADIFASLGDLMEEGSEEQKAFQIMGATINMLAGITAAVSGLFTTKSGPWDIALAAIQATAIAASGAATIAKMAKTNKNTAASSASSARTSATALGSIVAPVQYTQDVQGASIEGAIKDTRVYVTEGDISSTQKRVNVAESENRY